MQKCTPLIETERIFILITVRSKRISLKKKVYGDLSRIEILPWPKQLVDFNADRCNVGKGRVFFLDQTTFVSKAWSSSLADVKPITSAKPRQPPFHLKLFTSARSEKKIPVLS